MDTLTRFVISSTVLDCLYYGIVSAVKLLLTVNIVNKYSIAFISMLAGWLVVVSNSNCNITVHQVVHVTDMKGV
jgi:hypothetical protein